MRNSFTLVPILAALGAPAAADDTIVVTGHALEQPIGSQAYAVQTIDAAALRDVPGGLETALEAASGFQMFRRTDSRSANPTSQGAQLRGIGGNASSRALVLLDGVPVADPFAGWIPWPAIRPESLSSVRITTGGGAGAFGAGALTGVIELSSAGRDRTPVIGIDYGSRDSVAAYAGAAIPLGGGFIAIDAGYDRGDGFHLLRRSQRGAVDIPASYEQYGGSVRFVAPVGDETELQVRGAAFADDRVRGVEIVDSANSGADASVRLVSRGALPWEAVAYLQTRDFSSRFARIEADRSAAFPTLDQYAVPATGYGAKVEIRPTLGAHALRLGGDWRGARGETKEFYTPVAGVYTRMREAGGDSHVYGVYIEDDWRLSDALLLTGGVRLDRWSLTNGHLDERQLGGAVLTDTDFPKRSGTEPSGRLGLALSATPALTLRTAAYLGFRVPTLNELYRPFRVGTDATAANAALKPERLRGIEAGFDYRPLSTAHVSATVFYNRARNAIGNITLGQGPGTFPGVGFVAGAYRQRLNLDAVEAWGLEANAGAELGRVSIGLSYAFTHATVEASGVSVALDGMRPAQTPRHQGSVSAKWRSGGWNAGLAARYDGARYEDDLQTQRLDAALTLDAFAEAPLGNGLSLRLAAENLTDADVEAGRTSDGIIDRGQPRTVWVGVRWRPGR
ncbi:TonB-dependent receptor [Sphingosinicella soli]|uniref:Outer membrane receptor protein involved in Fe transport n=1 Tax=Sphingosinicella soli TaxID=333708 RepID=A0A7W7F6X5_9SPHN|nr:TonB-dependent receptor [Sphingosinicella soli]MBB4632149.1 outer membrane receptor protein involved in Fe transport [Sphingosinicella soli]